MRDGARLAPASRHGTTAWTARVAGSDASAHARRGRPRDPTAHPPALVTAIVTTDVGGTNVGAQASRCTPAPMLTSGGLGVG